MKTRKLRQLLAGMGSAGAARRESAASAGDSGLREDSGRNHSQQAMGYVRLHSATGEPE